MSAEDVLKRLEGTITRVCIDIKRKRTGSGADKLDSLSKLVNAYSRLLERSMKMQHDPFEHYDPNYYQRLFGNDE